MKTNVLARARLAVALAAAGCTPAPHAPPAPPAPARSPPAAEAVEPAAARLYRLLIGRYDSSAQAAGDAEFRVIHLTVCPADAPELGDRVLYVEQAAAEALDQPYRQRLYVVEPGAKGPASARSRVFELRAPAAAVGACARPERPRFAAADATERAGCAVELDWREGERTFAGATSGRACPSNLRGASYATSEVRLDAERLVSWDRGYDEAGKQVWGATKGPYEFVRRGERPR